MFFASDNWSGAHPKIGEALLKHSTGYAQAYGGSELDRKVAAQFNELFGREVAVHFVSTGTAANSLALAAYNKPGAICFSHRESHIREDECGAPEFIAPGARQRIVDGQNGKIDPQNLIHEIEYVKNFGVSGGTPALVSITQCTEQGTAYSLTEIAAISEIAKAYDLPLHLDGARFANAIAALGCSPAEMTWELGVDVVSFGGTKNGCWCAEALIFMNPDHAKAMRYLQKRSAQVFSKSRFVAAQFEAYLDHGLWLELSTHANNMATALGNAFRNSNQARLAWTPQANEVFAIMNKQKADEMRDAGAKFYDWPTPFGFEGTVEKDETIVRLVTSYLTEEKDVVAFEALLS